MQVTPGQKVRFQIPGYGSNAIGIVLCVKDSQAHIAWDTNEICFDAEWIQLINILEVIAFVPIPQLLKHSNRYCKILGEMMIDGSDLSNTGWLTRLGIPTIHPTPLRD